MEKRQIQLVLVYIENNLKSELNNKTLADISGYSEYHFIRIFEKYVNISPADYIRKRRISEIVKHLGCSNRTISDIAFEYGFNSKENFTRAFKKEHNILPTEWKTANCSLRLFDPFTFECNNPQPKVSIHYLNGFTLVAFSFNEEFPPKCWNLYNAQNTSLKLSGGDIVEDFGAMIWDSEKNRLRYYIGIKSELAKGDISDTIQININSGLYAVFETPPATQHDFVSTIRSTWDWIKDDWFPTSGYKRKQGYELESYIEKSRTYIEHIYIPIEKE